MVKCPNCTCPKMTELYTVLGKKWSIFILQTIAEGHHSFTEIRRNVGDANTKILTDRLRELIATGILEKCQTEGTYGLTEKGKQLTEKLIKLGKWWGESEK